MGLLQTGQGVPPARTARRCPRICPCVFPQAGCLTTPPRYVRQAVQPDAHPPAPQLRTFAFRALMPQLARRYRCGNLIHRRLLPDSGQGAWHPGVHLRLGLGHTATFHPGGFRVGSRQCQRNLRERYRVLLWASVTAPGPGGTACGAHRGQCGPGGAGPVPGHSGGRRRTSAWRCRWRPRRRPCPGSPAAP